MKRKKEYDMTRKARAMTGLGMRAVIAGYLGYLACSILRGARAGGGPIPEWGAWLIFFAFAAGAAGFCLFAWREYRKSMKAAEIPENFPVMGGDAGDAGESGWEPASENPEDRSCF